MFDGSSSLQRGIQATVPRLSARRHDRIRRPTPRYLRLSVIFILEISQNLEARGGIEPPIKVLQTFALPLGDRA